MNEVFAANFRILADGPFEHKNIHVTWNSEPLKLFPAVKKQVDTFWELLSKSYLYNGRLVRLDAWSSDNSSLNLQLSLSEYKLLMYSNKNADYIFTKWGHSQLSRALGLNAIVCTNDDRFVLIQRSKNVGEYPGKIDIVGGHIDYEKVESPVEIFSAVYKELNEEIGLESTFCSATCLALFETTANMKPELVFYIKTNLDFSDIKRAAETAVDSFEYENLFSISAQSEEIYRYIAQYHNEITPSALGSIYFYLKLAEVS